MVGDQGTPGIDVETAGLGDAQILHAMMIVALEARIAAGSTVLASLAVETITALAPLFSVMWVWSRSVLVV